MTLFRQHRGSLADAMKTVTDLKDREALEQDIMSWWCAGLLPDLADMWTESYGGVDERIDWDTWVVHLPGYGVLGFTDGPLQGLSQKAVQG